MVSPVFGALETVGSGVLRDPFPEFAATYCLDCHNAEDKKGKFDMEAVLEANPAHEFEAWESILWALQDRDMPPDDEPDVVRPAESEYESMLAWMEPWFGELEAVWEQEWHAAVLRQCLAEIAREVEPSTIAAFERFALRGESAESVARALGLSANAVYGAKRRVLQRIRELIPAMTEIW